MCQVDQNHLVYLDRNLGFWILPQAPGLEPLGQDFESVLHCTPLGF